MNDKWLLAMSRGTFVPPESCFFVSEKTVSTGSSGHTFPKATILFWYETGTWYIDSTRSLPLTGISARSLPTLIGDRKYASFFRRRSEATMCAANLGLGALAQRLHK